MGRRRNHVAVAAYIALLTFLTYTSVYAFRKPFTVARFQDFQLMGLPLQTVLIISQVVGYMLSKFAGIRIISALKRQRRWKAAALLIGTAWLALFLFAVLPYVLAPLLFMINGFCLGFMWGIVFSYAEGRRATDMIGSVLAVSFIFAGGFTRSVAKLLIIDLHVSEFWAPFLTGLIFVVPLIGLFYFLEKAPGPDVLDIEERVERVSMSKEDRAAVFNQYRGGLIMIAVGYGLLTIIRDIRDNYMGNMWRELGFADSASIFTTSETRITLIVLGVMALLILIRNNMLAFRVIHGIIMIGFLLAGLSSLLFLTGNLSGILWMQLVGLGLYMAYIPYNAIFFDRMIAVFRIKGNVGFLIYFIDAFGYLGTVCVMLVKESISLDMQWSSFYANMVVVVGFFGLAGTIFSLGYFIRKFQSVNQL